MIFLRLLIAATAFCMTALSSAQTYPSKPIRMVVGYSPGGSSDFVARLIAQLLGEQLKQSVVVENRPGAGGIIGADFVAKAAPDGYTLLTATSNELTLLQHVMDKLPFDALRDLSPIALVASAPTFMVVHPAVPVNNAKELLELAKAKGGLPYGSAGVGSVGHIAMELLTFDTQVVFTPVHYKGGSPAAVDLVAGRLPVAVVAASVAPHIHAGRVRALAVLQRERSSLMPNVPTFKESAGMEILDAGLVYAIMAPAQVPPAIRSRLESALLQALADPDLRSRLGESALEVLAIPAESSAARLRQMSAHYAQAIKRMGFKMK